MKTILSMLLVSISNIVFGLSLESKIITLTPESLFKKADLVVIANIVSGSYDEKSFTYSLRGKVQLRIKGSSKNEIEFSDLGLWENASRLSGNYLVFLQKNNGVFQRCNSSQAVIGLHRIEGADVPSADIFLKEIGINKDAAFSLYGKLWIVDYCMNKNDDVCKDFSEAFQFAMQQYVE